MRAMGIDIGTTSISLIMIDGETGKMLGKTGIAHRSFLKSPMAFAKIQSPERLLSLTIEGARELIDKFGKPDSIGTTGQMHGMLYVDKNGKAVSPLYTWQDGSGNELMKDGRTYAQVLQDATGAAAAGYGITTHFYLQKQGLIPDAAKKLVTLSDYIAMKLCGIREPFIAKDMAASWGCFDLESGDFLRAELEELGVELSYLPEVLPEHSVIGTTSGNFPKGIPVIASLGDNQASVIGSVKNLSDTVLINIGTGSQVSFCTDQYIKAQGAIELRPCTGEQYLMAGSGLCGGRAYAMLEQFYREASGIKDDSLYQKMEDQARDFIKTYGKEAAWKIRTTFSGTRSNPKERGSISSIGVENFCPGAMTLGMIQGILEELFEMYQEMCRMTGIKAAYLVGSGNGLRRNSLMREMAEDLFGMPMQIPACSEEAAYGAALQAMVSAGLEDSLENAQKKIQYI